MLDQNFTGKSKFYGEIMQAYRTLLDTVKKSALDTIDSSIVSIKKKAEEATIYLGRKFTHVTAQAPIGALLFHSHAAFLGSYLPTSLGLYCGLPLSCNLLLGVSGCVIASGIPIRLVKKAIKSGDGATLQLIQDIYARVKSHRSSGVSLTYQSFFLAHFKDLENQLAAAENSLPRRNVVYGEGFLQLVFERLVFLIEKKIIAMEDLGKPQFYTLMSRDFVLYFVVLSMLKQESLNEGKQDHEEFEGVDLEAFFINFPEQINEFHKALTTIDTELFTKVFTQVFMYGRSLTGTLEAYKDLLKKFERRFGIWRSWSNVPELEKHMLRRFGIYKTMKHLLLQKSCINQTFDQRLWGKLHTTLKEVTNEFSKSDSVRNLITKAYEQYQSTLLQSYRENIA